MEINNDIIIKPHGNKGKIPSEETRKKISLANTGRKCTEERRRNISLGMKKLYLDGKIMSEERRKRLSEIHKGKIISDKTKALMSINIRNGVYKKKLTIRVEIEGICYRSLCDAGRAHNISAACVKYRCGSLNFYNWKFIDEDKVLIKKLKKKNNDIINKC